MKKLLSFENPQYFYERSKLLKLFKMIGTLRFVLYLQK